MKSKREKDTEVVNLQYRFGATENGDLYMVFPELPFDTTDKEKVRKAEALCKTAATVLFAIQHDIDVDDIKF